LAGFRDRFPPRPGALFTMSFKSQHCCRGDDGGDDGGDDCASFHD
jgi:hypothetical protein